MPSSSAKPESRGPGGSLAPSPTWVVQRQAGSEASKGPYPGCGLEPGSGCRKPIGTQLAMAMASQLLAMAMASRLLATFEDGKYLS